MKIFSMNIVMALFMERIAYGENEIFQTADNNEGT